MNHLLGAGGHGVHIPRSAAANRGRGGGTMEATIPNPSRKRIALVTGGNKGVGLETCRQLASRGLRVVLTARNEARGLEAVEGIRRSGAGDTDVVFHQLDVTDPASVARLADFVRDQFGRLDVLINNAGISGVDRDPVLVAKVKDQVEGMDVDQRVEWMKENSKETYDEAKSCITTNYYGAKLVTEALLPLILLSSSGRIVNVSSGFGLLRNFNSEELIKEFNDIDSLTEKRVEELLDLFLDDFKANLIEAHGWPTGGSSAYKVAKAALNAYTRILSKKYPTLRINCLTPGYVKSDMSMHMGVLTPEEGASNPVKVALLPDDGPTGAYFDRNGEASFLSRASKPSPIFFVGSLEQWSLRCAFMEPTIFSSQDTRIAVVTGGNKGIGLEVCRQLAGNGIAVVLTARDEVKGAAAVEKLHGLGFSNVNNAAVGGIELVDDPSFGLMPTEDKTEETAKTGLETNYYGTKNVTETLLPLLLSSSDGRIVNIASDFGQLRFFTNEELKRELNDADSLTEERLDELLAMFVRDFEAGAVAERGWPTEFSAYKLAKAAVNAYTRILARKRPELRVNCVHPGYVKTELTRNSGLLTPEEGANRVVAVALLPAGGTTGAFFDDGKEASFARTGQVDITTIHHHKRQRRPGGRTVGASLIGSEKLWIRASFYAPASLLVRHKMEGAILSKSARVAVVTGGNKGIGLEVCRQLAADDITVVLTARDETRGTEATEKLRGMGLSNVVFHQLEVTDSSSVNNAALGGVEYTPGVDTNEEQFVGMDVLQRVEWMRKQCRETYDAAKNGVQTNYYGAKHVTQALLPLLLESSSEGRIVNVSSILGQLRLVSNEDLKKKMDDIDNLTEERIDEVLDVFLKDFEAGKVEADGTAAYKMAKVAMNAYSRILARRHPKLRINCAHPGYVKTDMTMNSGFLTPEEGARNVVTVALLPDGGPTGAFFDQGKEASFV
uniref:Uncharacterized protein n=1 Tax=Leersia perrieri TaxID=77586 RepID=A0A0D9W7I3_9ORYZ